MLRCLYIWDFSSPTAFSITYVLGFFFFPRRKNERTGKFYNKPNDMLLLVHDTIAEFSVGVKKGMKEGL